ncbi:MAG: tryptophan synthase subunit alpha [Sphaerochaetaceae bacterium]|nr:tryptophan synthase subunit alpha [Sphaerochaetaceae bacterium]
MKQFAQMFRSKDQHPTLVGYLPALYPDASAYQKILETCAQSGLQYMEIGIPHDDPYLDGDAIRDALSSVQKSHPHLETLIRSAIQAVRSARLTGIVMLYYETVAAFGLEEMARVLIEEQCDGVLIPNIPPQQRRELARMLEGTQVSTVNFVRYDTDRREMKEIIADTSGFLYLQSMNGSTGGAFKIDAELESKVETLQKLSGRAGLPVALGFGISSPVHARAAAETEADAIIVGTGLVVASEKGADEVTRFLGRFSPYLRHGRTQRYLLSVDIGTTALKSSIITQEGSLIDSAAEEYPLIAEGNAIEQDPELWWNAFCSTSRALQSRNPMTHLSAVVLSGHMQNLITLDGDDNLVGNAILYSDTRARKEFDRYTEEFGLDRAMQITRNRCDAASLPPKLLHLAGRNSITDKRFLLGAHDYVCWKLTGRHTTDLTNAATTGLLDYERNYWSHEILEFIGISEEQLPELETEATVTGKVTAVASRETALPLGLAVIHGSGDAGSSTVGVGAADENVFSCYLGTSGWVAATLPEAIDPAMGVFNLRHPDGHQTITIGAMRTTGGNISWLLETFSLFENKYEKMQEIAGKAPVGSKGVFYLPYLQGERMPFNDPHARGAFIGLSRETGQAHMFRSVIEGIAYGLASIYEVLRKASNSPLIRVVASGGGAENHLLTQTLADVLGVPVLKISDASNAGVRGNLVLAGKALGWFDSYSLQTRLMEIDQTFYPDTQAHEYHTKALPRFKRLYTVLKDEFNTLSYIE